MKCPACSADLLQKKIGGLTIDVCQQGCAGIWLDRDEILAIDEGHELDVSQFIELEPADEVAKKPPGERKCPRCPGQFLVSQNYDTDNPIEIDMCWNCSGIWLDHGELAAIRQGSGGKASGGNPYIQPNINISALHDSLGSAEKADSFLDKLGVLIGKLRSA
jgi:Zn-finger nucleic acid-binding protein